VNLHVLTLAALALCGVTAAMLVGMLARRTIVVIDNGSTDGTL
jgi:hypothetical protein